MGYVVGHDLVLEERYADGNPERVEVRQRAQAMQASRHAKLVLRRSCALNGFRYVDAVKITKANKPRSRAPARAKGSADECVFPPPVAATDLPRLVLPRDEEEVRKIAEYVEWQAKGETVEHAEKVSTEHVMGRNPGGCALRGERDGCARSQKNIDFERKSP